MENCSSNSFKLYLLFVFIFQQSLLNAQDIKIQVNGCDTRAYLYQLNGEKTQLVDSIEVDANGIYKFSLAKKDLHAGFFRLTFDNKNKWIDFINDGNDVNITTNTIAVLDSLRVVKSTSNELFYSFIRRTIAYKTKTDLLHPLLLRYPKDDVFFQSIKTKIIQINDAYMEFVTILSQKKPKSFIARYIRSARLPEVSTNHSPGQQLQTLKTHALDYVDFTDDELINSDLFTNRTIEYLTYYRNPQLTKNFLEKEFIVAVDTILNKAKVNAMVYQHIVEYLLDGFKKYGYDNVIDYIVQNYVIKDDLCLSENVGSILQRRIEQNRRFPIGMIAPNITIANISGKPFDLYESIKDKVLLVFYSSSCPHCKTMLPMISELQLTEKNFDVVAISLDTLREVWKGYIEKNSFNFIHVCDLKGWDGVAAKEYSIYATPTMFLLDSKKLIIAKPLTIEELKTVIAP